MNQLDLVHLQRPVRCAQVTLPMPPSANRYWRVFRGHVCPSSEAKAYKRTVGLVCASLRASYGEGTGDVRITADFYREAKRGDLDNRLKVLLDALRGHLFADDRQVIELHARRFEDPKNPRVELLVEVET